MKAGDLPIYGSLIDEKKEYVLVPKPDSKIRSYLYSIITPARQSVVHWYGTAESNSQKSVKFVVENSMSVYRRIEADPVILARGGFITVCGLGGIVLGSKGGVLRQIAYGSLGGGIGTVMCYPTCSLKTIIYAWDASTSKLLETTERVKRKFKGAVKSFIDYIYFHKSALTLSLSYFRVKHDNSDKFIISHAA